MKRRLQDWAFMIAYVVLTIGLVLVAKALFGPKCDLHHDGEFSSPGRGVVEQCVCVRKDYGWSCGMVERH